ncbi:hypothetical protein B0T24DRAFT_626216 [Lasiosphaeria ovina]|uniref:Uncharacterized protein n=1 Tax=Lasiosphaeria ovina TaxID=92902 RepID=A0AAE0KD13_9PEZI|nr:hypothetical protein B0T24DRAFT_626216 [Lasiosphaeria ovina]
MRLPTPLLAALALASTASCSVVVLPGGDPKPYSGIRTAVTNAHDFFNGSAENEFIGNKASVLMSSFGSWSNVTTADGIFASGDSFVRGTIQAWGEHLHLVVRPEEVWFTILVQMNFYMNSHAEELRSMFVSHTGQEVIYIEDFTWYDVLRRFQFEIQKRVKTEWLLDWIRPNFTTTTESDVMTANILMMGLTKAYFKFEGAIVCGLPSVTLLGEERDWVALLAKLDRLEAFGVEPKEYARRLRPILSRFVRTFREPDSPEIRRFWNEIAVATATGGICGAPPVTLSGWITGFYYWNDKGGPYARAPVTESGIAKSTSLDGIAFPNLDIQKLPVGYARAPFVMRDFADVPLFEAYVAAGTMGKQITAGAPEGYADALKRVGGDVASKWLGRVGEKIHATLKPLSAWMLYGPIAHNTTTKYTWMDELDLVELTWSLRRSLTNQTCRAP